MWHSIITAPNPRLQRSGLRGYHEPHYPKKHSTVVGDESPSAGSVILWCPLVILSSILLPAFGVQPLASIGCASEKDLLTVYL